MDPVSTYHLEKFEHTSDKFGARPVNPNGAITSAKIHEYGSVALLATYGSDELIADTARVSYGKGTVKTSNTRQLLRYLMRNRHTSPFEHAEVTFYLRAPIFVIRQLIRHRTANVNEYSARYSELSNDFYIPTDDYLAQQSTTNKQGRGDALPEEQLDHVRQLFFNAQQQSMDTYTTLLRDHNVSRELARIVTSVGNYTELYWKCDLHNFFHFLKLRMDPHAQREIRDFANAMCAAAAPFFPIAFEAWNDYIRRSYTLSYGELSMLKEILREHMPTSVNYPTNSFGLSDREYNDFTARLDEWRD